MLDSPENMAGYSELVLKQFPAENIVLCITRVKDVITNKIETDCFLHT